MKAWTKILLCVFAITVAGTMGCSGNSGSSSGFAGVNQTYILQGGIRKLTLNGLTGVYQATTYSGVNRLAVSLTQNQITVGGLPMPYMAVGNLFQGGGLMGFASGAVSADPTKFPATYNTLVGANFAGQLAIAADATYTWCRASTFLSTSGCADGTLPRSGSIVLRSSGFGFAGLPGTYAVYHQATASALFAVDNRGLVLRALSQTVAQPLVSRFGNKFSIQDASFDLLSGLGPEEGLSALVPVVQEACNGALQLGHAEKAAAADGLMANHAEPALDQVEPR